MFIFLILSLFSFQITSSLQDSYGAHVKTANGNFSYNEFWDEIQNAITTVTFRDKVRNKIQDIVKSQNMSENTASNKLFESALSHFTTKIIKVKWEKLFYFL